MDGESLVLYCRVLRGLLNSHVGSVENGVDLGPTGGQMIFSRKASGRARAVALNNLMGVQNVLDALFLFTVARRCVGGSDAD